jgi:hypothetical protein
MGRRGREGEARGDGMGWDGKWPGLAGFISERSAARLGSGTRLARSGTEGAPVPEDHNYAGTDSDRFWPHFHSAIRLNLVS